MQRTTKIVTTFLAITTAAIIIENDANAEEKNGLATQENRRGVQVQNMNKKEMAAKLAFKRKGDVGIHGNDLHDNFTYADYKRSGLFRFVDATGVPSDLPRRISNGHQNTPAGDFYRRNKDTRKSRPNNFGDWDNDGDIDAVMAAVEKVERGRRKTAGKVKYQDRDHLKGRGSQRTNRRPVRSTAKSSRTKSPKAKKSSGGRSSKKSKGRSRR